MSRKRNELNIADKIKVIDDVNKKIPYAKIAEKYNIGKSTVVDIMKKKRYHQKSL